VNTLSTATPVAPISKVACVVLIIMRFQGPRFEAATLPVTYFTVGIRDEA